MNKFSTANFSDMGKLLIPMLLQSKYFHIEWICLNAMASRSKDKRFYVRTKSD